MIQIADHVAERDNISRTAQDDYVLQDQYRRAAAQAAARFDEEMVPMEVVHNLMDREGKVTGRRTVVARADEVNRPDTTVEALAQLRPVREGGSTTAGNASQLSDGASVCVLAGRRFAYEGGLPELGISGDSR
jgi:acetyl-CoA C-acetyltransferase